MTIRPAASRVAIRITSAVLALGALCGGCAGGTETGNPPFTLSYTAYSSDPATASVQTDGAPYVVQSLWLDLGAAALSADPACGSGSASLASASIPGLGIGDHAQGAHNFTSFQAPSGQYCRLELPFLEAPGNAASSELAGYSLVLSGKLADSTRFRIRSHLTKTFRLLGNSGGFELSEARPAMLVAFDVAAWLRGIELESAERVDGVIELSATQNPTALAAFEGNLPAGVALYRDAGNGTLGAVPEQLADSN